MPSDTATEEFIHRFIDSLPDPAGATAFHVRLQALGSDSGIALKPLLLSRILTLASYSPMLGETLISHPEYIGWLDREASYDLSAVKTTERLAEDLARFVVGNLTKDRRVLLSLFKRRELLRIYLRDCLRIATLTEVTEELSNLADAILSDALAQAYQEVARVHGAPLERDSRGRITAAEMAVVALGKLGCRELNYASDIDLLFLYSGTGQTAGDPRVKDSSISNKQFFTAVAERVVQMIGSNTGEGAVYRIDLRLRPYGRDGDLVWDVDRASEYYCRQAQNWERQALLRARVSAGSERVASKFLDNVRDAVFSTEPAIDFISSVQRHKEQIDRKVATRGGGFNVKLGPGGIREIEFIAQALQLQHGGHEPWIRPSQTLIVLARLAEKGFLSDTDRIRLAAAYNFLRTVEHRLQMEHGAQTHSLPVGPQRLDLVARRCGYSGSGAGARLIADLEKNTAAVREVYQRVFAGQSASRDLVKQAPSRSENHDDSERLLVNAKSAIARLFERQMADTGREAEARASGGDWIEQAIRRGMSSTISPRRAVRNLFAWAESLATYEASSRRALASKEWSRVIECLTVALSSPYLSNILISRPNLIGVLAQAEPSGNRDDYLARFAAASIRETGVAAKSDALRRTWYEQILRIGFRDMSRIESVQTLRLAEPNDHALNRASDQLKESNRAQTALAEATLLHVLDIALEPYGLSEHAAREMPFSILALGRLGHAGMDYGSDLDLVVVYDDSSVWPPSTFNAETREAISASSSRQEFFARLTTQIVNTLGVITREGTIYRVDLRLRPEGASGPLVRNLSSFLSYVADRASAWEHSAYLKLREIGGNPEFGARVRQEICGASFTAASRNKSLKRDLHEMRMRLEREKARGGRPDIKWGRGGMVDAYFITRFLQLDRGIYFPPEEGTAALIAHLGETGQMPRDAASELLMGYTFLRRLDHWMRLLVERPTAALPRSSVSMSDLAEAMRVESPEALETELAVRQDSVREIYLEILT